MSGTISVDYLVVGAGAMGMAFADTLISDSTATIAIVDRYARPGGHWTIAYPHVRLHQPSVGYGVNSQPFVNEDKIDQYGWNEGLLELASGDEVRAYYHNLMQRTFLPSGRVQYFPKHEYTGDGKFRSLFTNKTYSVDDRTRIVDATYMKVEVPAMRPPPYEVADGVEIITPNALAQVNRAYEGYTVVGVGKTGIDACLFLLGEGVDPKKITWIVSRDPWILDRLTLQPGPQFESGKGATLMAMQTAIMEATSPEDMFHRLEKMGQLMRLSANHWPTYYRCSTVTQKEFAAIKQIGNIVRSGHVQRITKYQVSLTNGQYKAIPDTLYVDCSANSIPKRKPAPVFNGRDITLQPVRFCQQVFSAAFIAHVEATYGKDEKLKNELTMPVPHPETATDYIRLNLQSNQNVLSWAVQPKTQAWLAKSRLDFFGQKMMPQPPKDPEQAAVFYAEMGKGLVAMVAKLNWLMLQLPEDDGARDDVQLAKL